MIVGRGDSITALCAALKAAVPAFRIVKPYHGELDRYSKKLQLKEETFPATVNLATPFALIISKDRRRIEGQGRSLRWKHDISIYIGVANQHNFSDENVPEIFSILDQCVDALNGKSLGAGCGSLEIDSDGEYLITTDLFTVYDQKYHQLEIGT